MKIAEIQDELFRLEYPTLSPDHDPDIDRYFYLRSSGHAKDALDIYQSRIKPRYPNDEFRTALIRSYRNHSSQFRGLLAIGYRALGARSLERIKRVLRYMAEKADSYDPRDVYSTVRAAEDILKFFPPDQYEAMTGMERYLRYAEALNFYEKSIAKAVELIRSYLNQSLSVVEEERQRRAADKLKAREAERKRLVKADWDSYQYQKKYGGQAPLIDFSAVVFSPEDLARIEIPRSLNSLEDKTLAYCVKYWNLVEDQAFERILFLYSRKYGTKHYDVYMAIRRGRLANHRDDEILQSVLSALVTGYYYSIQGDRYLQQRWNLIKGALTKPSQRNVAPRPVLPAPAKHNASMKRDAPKKRPQPGKVKKRTPAKKATISEAATVKKKKQKAHKQLKAGKAELKEPFIREETVSREAAIPISAEPKKAGGSVSERLQELSGRSYDVYQERFLSHARVSIRKILGAGKGLFYTIPEQVEDLVFNFLKTHYEDPYMNWPESEERKILAGMGFEVASLNPVIDDCYRKL